MRRLIYFKILPQLIKKHVEPLKNLSINHTRASLTFQVTAEAFYCKANYEKQCLLLDEAKAT